MGVLCMLLASWSAERAEVAVFTESLVKLRSGFRTIEIDFTLTRNDTIDKREFTGKFVMLREKTGALNGLLQFAPTADPRSKETWVLRDEVLYQFDDFCRTVTKHSAAKAGVLEYVASALPGVWLLAPHDARNRCEVRFLKRDANYRYFSVKVKKQASGLFGEGRESQTVEYRFAVVAQESPGFPHSAIRQAALFLPNGNVEQWKITRWVIDGPRGLSLKDFPDPTKPPPGWKIQEWKGWDALWEDVRKELEEKRRQPSK